METKKKYNILEAIQWDINRFEKDIASVKVKFDEDLIWNFSSYMGGYITDNFVLKHLKGAYNFIEKNPEKHIEWLETNINIKVRMLVINQLSHSTNPFSNLQEEKEREGEQKLIELYVKYYSLSVGENPKHKFNYILF